MKNLFNAGTLALVILAAACDVTVKSDGNAPAASSGGGKSAVPPETGAPGEGNPTPPENDVVTNPEGDAMVDTKKVVWSGPITITKGGTYTGNWQSLKPSVAAVTVNTTQPVVITNSNMASRGHVIRTVTKVNLTVTHSGLTGLNPAVKCASQGRAVEADSDFSQLVFSNNAISGTRGIQVQDHNGAGKLVITANRVNNIDERRSDGTGYYFPSSLAACGDQEHATNSDGTQDDGQFLQMANVTNLTGAEVGWNEVINLPGQSRVEDNISLYQATGTPSSYINIHDNFIQGAYPTDAANQTDYSGGGIMAGDGGGAYVLVTGNVVIQDKNYGIACSNGHDMIFSDNRTLQSGKMPDGSAMHANSEAGISRRSCTNIGTSGTNASNVAGFTTALTATNYNAWAGNTTLTKELAEKTTFETRAKQAGVLIGP